LLDIAAHACST